MESSDSAPMPVELKSRALDSTEMLVTAGDWITDSITGLPAPIRKNAWKAFGQLCTAAIQVPVVILEGVVLERRAETNARVILIEQIAKQISSGIDVDPAFAELAAQKYAKRIVREQVNIEKISKVAIAELQSDKDYLNGSSEGAELSDDWLNNFEREAREKSTDEMQLLFARILAGEIKKPASFSIHTVRLIGQLDSKVAELFVRFCSLAVTLGVGDNIIDVRVIAIDKPAGKNGLREFGLGYSSLTLLQEHGLVSASLDSHVSYQLCVTPDDLIPPAPLKYQGEIWGLKLDPKSTTSTVKGVRGVSLTRVGRELSKIVDIKPDSRYTKCLMQKFAALGFAMVLV